MQEDHKKFFRGGVKWENICKPKELGRWPVDKRFWCLLNKALLAEAGSRKAKLVLQSVKGKVSHPIEEEARVETKKNIQLVERPSILSACC